VLNNECKPGLRGRGRARDTIDLMMQVCDKVSENRFGFIGV